MIPHPPMGALWLLRALLRLTLVLTLQTTFLLLLSLPWPAQCHSCCSSCSYTVTLTYLKKKEITQKEAEERDEKAALFSFMQFNTYTLAQIKFEPGLQSAFLGTVTAPGQAQSL